MSELFALVADPGYDEITHAGPDARQYTVFGLRQEGEKPLDLPADGNKTRTLSEVVLPLPNDQPERVREYFKHYLVKRPEKQAWDCRRFTGFVALDTPLVVSVLERPIDIYSTSQDTTTTRGVAYEFFKNSQPAHSAIGLGGGTTLGVNGSFGYMAVGGINQLRRDYGDQQHKILERRFSRTVSDDRLMEIYGGSTIEEAELLCFMSEQRASFIERFGMPTMSNNLRLASLDMIMQDSMYIQLPELGWKSEPRLAPIRMPLEYFPFTHLDTKVTSPGKKARYDTEAIRGIFKKLKMIDPVSDMTDPAALD